MKKIFLTSGLVLCMACPAFADASWNGATSGTESTGCTQPNLGVYSGATQMDAIWTQNVGSITFDNDSSYTQTQCGANNTTVTHDDATAGAPTTLWTRYDDAVYGTEAGRDASTVADKITSLSSTPALTGYTFGGYYAEAALTNQKITALGAIDSTVKNMVTEDGGTATLYAKWTPKTYSDAITYACGTAGTNTTVAAKANTDMSDDVTFDDCYSLAAVTEKCTVPEDFGWTFDGWECKTGNPATNATMPHASAETNGYYASGAGGVWDNDTLGTAGVTCTAKWAPKTIGDITWSIGTGATAGTGAGSTTCVYEGSVTLPGAPSKTGYTFGGWQIHQ